MITIPLEYWYDYGDHVEWEAETEGELEAAYLSAIAEGLDPNEIEELEPILESVRDEIEEHERECMEEQLGDEFDPDDMPELTIAFVVPE